jgi:hypothetical protein
MLFFHYRTVIVGITWHKYCHQYFEVKLRLYSNEVMDDSQFTRLHPEYFLWDKCEILHFIFIQWVDCGIRFRRSSGIPSNFDFSPAFTLVMLSVSSRHAEPSCGETEKEGASTTVLVVARSGCCNSVAYRWRHVTVHRTSRYFLLLHVRHWHEHKKYLR